MIDGTQQNDLGALVVSFSVHHAETSVFLSAPSQDSTFQRGITPRFRVKRFGDRASTMALLARFSSDFSLQIES